MTMRTTLATMALLFSAATTTTAQVQVTTNFSKWVEYPLVKKIGVYQTPLTCEKWIARDVPKMSQIEARSFRYEFAWGKDLYGSDAISGTKANPVLNLFKADKLFDRVSDHTEAFVFAHGYMPAILQSSPGGLGWQSVPSDYEAWRTVNNKAAAHWRQKGYRNRYVEVWNEPDLPGGFFSGTMDDYLRIYHYAALGAREGDADCKVGGPAIAYMTWWHDALVAYARENNLPVDFLSGHAYGHDFTWQLDAMRNALNNFGNNGAEMLLTEYSPYSQADYAANGPVERAEAAMTFFEALPTMMEYPDLTHVTWAQYIDPEAGNSELAFSDWDKLGLVDGNDGCRKALFNAFRLYGMMPVNRYLINTGSLSGMSSGDEEHVATVVWNTTDKGKRARVNMTNIPFKEGIVETYHIDKRNNSWYENAVDEFIPTSVSRQTFSNGIYNVVDSVRDQGVFFVRISAIGAKPLFMRNPFAKFVKTHQWFTSRTNTAPYAYFDPKTWTAYLSTNAQANGWAIVGATADEVPQTFSVKSINSGNLRNTSSDAALCLRVDFQSEDGAYRKAVVFHGGLYHENRTQVVPWGTKRKPDNVVQVDDFAQFDIDLRPYMPSDYSGRAIISFDMSATGTNAKANIQLLSNEQPRISNVQIDSLSGNTAKLSFVVDGPTSGISKAGFKLAIDADPAAVSTAKTYTAQLEGNTFSATIPALTYQRNYHVRGFIDNTFTSENMFYTARLAAIATSAVRCDVEALSAVLNGNVTSENGSKVVERGFVWSLAEESAEPTLKNHVIPQGNGLGTYKYELTGLSPEADYVVRAYAINRAGVAYGKPRTFTTRQTDAITIPQTDANSSSVKTARTDYNVSGHRVGPYYKGLVITNGAVKMIRR